MPGIPFIHLYGKAVCYHSLAEVPFWDQKSNPCEEWEKGEEWVWGTYQKLGAEDGDYSAWKMEQSRAEDREEGSLAPFIGRC